MSEQIHSTFMKSRPEVGGIYMAQAPEVHADRGHLVLVTKVDSRRRIAVVSLLSPDVDLISDIDVVLPREETSYHVDLLAQADVVGPIYWTQLTRRLAGVAAETASAIGDAVEEGFSALGDRIRGLAVRRDDHVRRSFKGGQLEAFRYLAGACVRQMVLSEVEGLDLDPAVLDAIREGDTTAADALVVDESEALRAVPLDVVEELLAGGLDVRQLGPDIARVVERLLLEGLEEAGSVGRGPIVGWDPERSAQHEPGLERLLRYRRAHGETCIRLVSAASAWAAGGVPEVAVVEVDAIRIQLNCESEVLTHG